MLPDYLVLNGYEIINSLRANAYGARDTECGTATSGCFDCPGLEEWLTNGEMYKGVTADPAPWYDPAAPESARIYGVVGLAIEGLANGAYPQQANADESATGAVRDIMFRVLVEVADECAATYAAGWLREAIGASPCADRDCAGAWGCMLACCPVFDPETGQPDVSPLRTMYGLRAVEGPEEIERGYDADRIYLIYEFTLRTTNVDVYRPPPADRVITVSPALGKRTRIDLDTIYDACKDDVSCLVDPLNPVPPPPKRRRPPRDPRYPGAAFNARRTLISIPAEWMSSRLPMVPVITVTPGINGPIRNFLFRTYHNPFGVECSRLPALNPCRACSDALVTYVPRAGQLVIDGRTNTELITCRGERGGTATENALIFGEKGDAYTPPVFVCGGALCVEIYAADPVPPGALVTVEFHTRAGAG